MELKGSIYMKEQLITFNTAQLAKEKGFDGYCYDCFNQQGNLYSNGWCEYIDDNGIKNHFTKEDIKDTHYLRPTQSLLQKWLRDKFQIHIVFQDIFNMKTNEIKYYPVLNLFGKQYDNLLLPKRKNKGAYIYLGDVWKESYEEALEFGLQEALKLI